MKKHFLLLFAVLVFSTVSKNNLFGLTNVSGGIYTNATWTLANSPYVITDTITVFPGVTLTIEPGVTILFDNNKPLEIRQGRIIAEGTATDSIIFTSNSPSPATGIYPGIFLNNGSMVSRFNFCSINYAIIGVNATVTDSLVIRNSNFKYDSIGIQFIGHAIGEVAIIDSCIMSNISGAGLYINLLISAVITNCIFSYSNTGAVIGDYFTSTSQFYGIINDCIFDHDTVGMSYHVSASEVNRCKFTNNQTGFNSWVHGQILPYQNYVRHSEFTFNQLGAYTSSVVFDSCRISNNYEGIHSVTSTIAHCNIDSNQTIGVTIVRDQVSNCNIRYNATGVLNASSGDIINNNIQYNSMVNVKVEIMPSSHFSTITGNTITDSPLGIHASGYYTISNNIIDNNDTGIILLGDTGTLTCNRICSNNIYALYYLGPYAFDASHNYWCTADSATTEAIIFDGYDNINYGPIAIMPFDSICYLSTGLKEINQQQLKIYPNPGTHIVYLNLPKKILSVSVYNLVGKKMDCYVSKKDIQNELNIENLNAGIYLIEVFTEDGKMINSFVKSDY
jgi:hypothetical protein